MNTQTVTQKQSLNNTIKVALKTLMEMHPSQRDASQSLIDKIESQSLTSSELLQEMRKLGTGFIQSKDQDTIAFRMVASEVSKKLKRLQSSPHLSAKQRELLEKTTIKNGASPSEAIKSLSDTCQLFANDALHLREQSKVIVGEKHHRLKKDDNNIIAGDVAWSSKQILKSITPLLQRTQREHPDCPNISKFYDKSKELGQLSVVDFFESVALMEDSLRAITRLQGKKNDAEADYLKTFHQHLKSMHNALDVSIRQNASFEKASDNERVSLMKIMNGFKDTADNENDPEKLKKLIADNVSHMKDGFKKIMDRQDVHIRQQQRSMETLRAESRDYAHKNKQINEEKERLNQALESIEMLSIVDELTQIPNRRAYDNALRAIDQRVSESNTQKERHGMIVIDIDNFKMLNDTYGHQLGDKALETVSGLLSRLIKSSKTLKDNAELYRYGGEEFVVLYRDLAFTDATKLAEGLRTRVAAKGCKIRDEMLTITVSMGVAAYSENHPQGADVFELADKAMYDAKKGGRNLVYANHKGKTSPVKRTLYPVPKSA